MMWYFFVVVCCVSLASVNTLSYSDASITVQALHVLEGYNVTLECNGTAAPDPDYNSTGQAAVGDFYWVKNDTDDTSSELYGSDWRLQFIPISRNDSGTYICYGFDNSTGENITMSTTVLDVQFPPSPDSIPQYFYEASYFGVNISMTFALTANPVPDYTWSRDDNKPFGSVAEEDSATGSTLTIYVVAVDDFGNYTLVVNNSAGSYVANFTLRANGIPEAPYNLRASNITYNSTDLSWTSGYDMGSHQQFRVMKWIGDSYMPVGNPISEPYENGGVGQTWTFHLSGLTAGAKYEFEIVSENAVGFSFSDPNVKFNIPPGSTFPLPSRSTPPAATSPPGDAGSSSVIVGCSVAGTVILLAAVTLAYIFYRKRYQKQFTVEQRFTIDRIPKRSSEEY